MRRKRVIPALLVLAVITAAALFTHYWHKDSKKAVTQTNNKLRIKTITKCYDDASGLPMSCEAIGATLTLREVKMLPGGYIKAILVLDLPATKDLSAPIVTGDAKVFGIDAETLGCSSYYKGDNYKRFEAGQKNQMIVEQKYRLVNKYNYVDRVSITQELHYDRPQKHVSFKFSHFAPGNLPQSKSSRGVKVTLQRFINGAAGEAYENYTCLEGNRIGLLIKEDCPKDAIHEGATLYDQHGNIINWIYEQSSCEATYDYVPEPILSTALSKARPNLKERTVGVFDSAKAEEMMVERVTNTLLVNGKMTLLKPALYVYKLPKPYPQKFNLEWSCTLPTDAKDVVWVRFDNVPVKPLKQEPAK